MRLTKGQYTIGEVFMFAISITFAVMVFLLMASSGNIVNQKVEKQVDYSIGEVRKRSVITVTMKDYMWRAPTEVNPGGGPVYEGVDRDKYGDMPAYKVISYYFSTSSDRIFVNGKAIPREEVRKDIRNYMRYKMKQHWNSGGTPVQYYLNLSATNVQGAPDPVVVKSGDYEPSGRWSRVSFPLALTDSQEATVTLWTKTSQGIYTVRPG